MSQAAAAPVPNSSQIAEDVKKQETGPHLQPNKTVSNSSTHDSPGKFGAAEKSAPASLHQFEAPPASGAPKELELLLHGKTEQSFIFGMKKEFFFPLLFIVFMLVAGYFFVGTGFTH
jgi:lipopolysaccharide export LptBFGC system permease protein LptF